MEINVVFDINELGAKSKPKRWAVASILEHLSLTVDTDPTFREEHEHLHESFTGPCIPYFDFDGFDVDRGQSLAALRSAVMAVFPTGRVIYADRTGWSRRHGANKVSLRAYVRGAGYFPNPPSVWEYVKDTPIGQLVGIDANCYKSRQNLGLCYNTKMGDARVLRILDAADTPMDWDENMAGLLAETFVQVVLPTDGECLAEAVPISTASVSSEVGSDIVEKLESEVHKLMPNVVILRVKTSGEHMVYELSKSDDECPLCGRVHRKNRNYITMIEGRSFLKCHRDTTKRMPLVEIATPPSMDDLRSMMPRWASEDGDEGDEDDEDDEVSVEAAAVSHSASGGDALELTLLRGDHMDADYAEYFTEKYASQFIVFDGRIYYFGEGRHTWKACPDDGILYTFLGREVYNSLRVVLDATFRDISDAEKHAEISKRLLKLRNWKTRAGIVAEVKAKIQVSVDPFDMNPSLVGFKNGVYDLDAATFRAGVSSDFVSKTVGYDYVAERDPVRLARVSDFIAKIMPRADEREFLMRALASGIYGKTVQNMFILTGEGGNGKDTLVSKFYRDTIGTDLYEYSSNTILTEKRKGDLCQGISNMGKKRAVVWSEPPKQSTLQGAIIKEITGVDQVNARGLYSTNTVTKIMATCFLLCNDIPKVDSVDGGLARRLCVILFRSLFKSREEMAKMTNLENVYEMDAYYDTAEFRRDHRMELFHLLTDAFATFKADGYLIKRIPKSVRDASAAYLQGSDEFMGWFLSVYEKGAETDYIKLADVWKHYKGSDFHCNLNKAEKRLMNKAKLISDVAKNPTLRGYFKDRHQPVEGGRPKNYTNVIMGYTLKVDEPDTDGDESD